MVVPLRFLGVEKSGNSAMRYTMIDFPSYEEGIKTLRTKLYPGNVLPEVKVVRLMR